MTVLFQLNGHNVCFRWWYKILITFSTPLEGVKKSKNCTQIHGKENCNTERNFS